LLPSAKQLQHNLEDIMKKLALAAALSVAATTGYAGTLAEPVIEAPVIVEETNASSSAAAVWVPLLILAIVAAAIAAD
jgi:activator of 2-hydroxyglutaryl-CoA dehydratase